MVERFLKSEYSSSLPDSYKTWLYKINYKVILCMRSVKLIECSFGGQYNDRIIINSKTAEQHSKRV